jgi:type I restriction enzyme S subunit
MYEVKKGDFILSGIDARNGAFGIIPKELDGAIVTNDFWYFEIDENIISKRLFLELTATTWFDEICKKGSDGTTQRIRLQKNKFFNQKVILPLKEEQELLLEKLLKLKENKAELQNEIQIQKESITQLKQSILQEAIQGKLTQEWRKQNPDIEPASELLKRIKVEKAKLIKEKKIRKEKQLPPITQEEIPFELPDGWVWWTPSN